MTKYPDTCILINDPLTFRCQDLNMGRTFPCSSSLGKISWLSLQIRLIFLTGHILIPYLTFRQDSILIIIKIIWITGHTDNVCTVPLFQCLFILCIKISTGEQFSPLTRSRMIRSGTNSHRLNLITRFKYQRTAVKRAVLCGRYTSIRTVIDRIAAPGGQFQCQISHVKGILLGSLHHIRIFVVIRQALCDQKPEQQNSGCCQNCQHPRNFSAIHYCLSSAPSASRPLRIFFIEAEISVSVSVRSFARKVREYATDL